MRSCKYWIFPPFLSFKPFSLHIFIKTWIRNFSPRHNSEMENKQTWKFLRKCNPRDSLSTCPLKKIILFFFLLHPPPSSSLSQSESKHSDPCLRCRLKNFCDSGLFFFFIYLRCFDWTKFFKAKRIGSLRCIYLHRFISIRFRTKLGLMTVFVDFQKGKFDRTRNHRSTLSLQYK